MREIEGIENALRVLSPYQSEIEEHFNRENEKFKKLMQMEHDSIGHILKCHLIVEHYLDSYLVDHYGIEKIEKVKLSFIQKARLLPDSSSASAFVKPSIVELNAIRNKIGHNLDINIKPQDLINIRKVLKLSKRGPKFNNINEELEAFTTVACTMLIVAPVKLKKLFKKAFSKIKINSP